MATKKAAEKTAAKQPRLRNKQGRYEQAPGEEAMGQEPPGGVGGAKENKERPVRCIHRHADVELRRAFPKLCEKLMR